MLQAKYQDPSPFGFAEEAIFIIFTYMTPVTLKVGQGQQFFSNLVGLPARMLQAKYQHPRPFGY